MKKLAFVIGLLLFVLTACNFPLIKTPNDQEMVATRVAATLFAAQTAVIPTNPPLPTDETGMSTETPTLTPLPTDTATPTATITAPANDPVLTLGTPGFSDTFSNGVSFGLATPYQDDGMLIKVENGSMVFKSLAINAGKRWRLTSRNPKNLYLEGSFRTSSCSGTDQYGLVFRAPTYSDGIGYYFGVSCNGQYYFLRWDNSGSNTLLNWTPESRINAGSNQVNHLGVMANEDTFRLYINGSLVKELTDKGITEKGYIGAFASAFEDPNFTVLLDEISLWTLQ